MFVMILYKNFRILHFIYAVLNLIEKIWEWTYVMRSEKTYTKLEISF